MNPDFPLLSIYEERLKRVQSRQNEAMGEHAEFLAALPAYAGGAATEHIMEAYRYAQSIDYHHPGLSARAYLAHPVRVALLSLQLAAPMETEIVIAALLHNLLEVTSVPADELTRRYGASVAETIINLTVDRSLQNDKLYKQGYYARLRGGSRAGRVVKVLDKLDNLFLLCLNPDDHVRTDYLAEVEDYILPMAHGDLPVLDVYLKDLVRDCRTEGYHPTIQGASKWN